MVVFKNLREISQTFQTPIYLCQKVKSVILRMLSECIFTAIKFLKDLPGYKLAFTPVPLLNWVIILTNTPSFQSIDNA